MGNFFSRSSAPGGALKGIGKGPGRGDLIGRRRLAKSVGKKPGRGGHRR